MGLWEKSQAVPTHSGEERQEWHSSITRRKTAEWRNTIDYGQDLSGGIRVLCNLIWSFGGYSFQNGRKDREAVDSWDCSYEHPSAVNRQTSNRTILVGSCGFLFVLAPNVEENTWQAIWSISVWAYRTGVRFASKLHLHSGTEKPFYAAMVEFIVGKAKVLPVLETDEIYWLFLKDIPYRHVQLSWKRHKKTKKETKTYQRLANRLRTRSDWYPTRDVLSWRTSWVVLAG